MFKQLEMATRQITNTNTKAIVKKHQNVAFIAEFHLEFHDLRFNITLKNLNYTTWTYTQKRCSVVFSFSCAHNTKVIIHIKEHPC